MNYFVRFNQNANKLFAIHTFNEVIRAAERDFSVKLKVEDISQGDALTAEVSNFLVKDSISKIEILNENEVVVFSTALYTEAVSLDVTLDLNFDLDDDDVTNDKEISYVLSFRKE